MKTKIILATTMLLSSGFAMACTNAILRNLGL